MSRLIPARAGNISSLRFSCSSQPAHPRSRGEHCVRVPLTTAVAGSSPLARGTCHEALALFRAVRLIPARAGNIRVESLSCRSRSAHPRSRGEHSTTTALTLSRNGSSPLARGTFHPTITSTRALRLIPARAGNMWSQPSCAPHISAHPRSRGEHLQLDQLRTLTRGSSPLARGTYDVFAKADSLGRLIPARAGNIYRVLPAVQRVAAHPRSRGEHTVEASAELASVGSSPLARGTFQRLPRQPRTTRLIPARAGNIDKCRLVSERVPGSSPLARGTCTIEHDVSTLCRLIPARAGNILNATFKCFCNTAHPRSRGEHLLLNTQKTPPDGSSPLARGTLS